MKAFASVVIQTKLEPIAKFMPQKIKRTRLGNIHVGASNYFYRDFAVCGAQERLQQSLYTRLAHERHGKSNGRALLALLGQSSRHVLGCVSNCRHITPLSCST